MKTIGLNKIEKTAKSLGLDSYSFYDDFLEIAKNKASNYDDVKDFFADLRQSGCVSGRIPALSYNSDCKVLYVSHLDSLEDFKNKIENESGEPIKNENGLPHYTFVVWLCFEEFCFRIYDAMFE